MGRKKRIRPTHSDAGRNGSRRRARESLMAVDEAHETTPEGVIGAGAQECGTCRLLWQKEGEEAKSKRRIQQMKDGRFKATRLHKAVTGQGGRGASAVTSTSSV